MRVGVRAAFVSICLAACGQAAAQQTTPASDLAHQLAMELVPRSEEDFPGVDGDPLAGLGVRQDSATAQLTQQLVNAGGAANASRKAAQRARLAELLEENLTVHEMQQSLTGFRVLARPEVVDALGRLPWSASQADRERAMQQVLSAEDFNLVASRSRPPAMGEAIQLMMQAGSETWGDEQTDIVEDALNECPGRAGRNCPTRPKP